MTPTQSVNSMFESCCFKRNNSLEDPMKISELKSIRHWKLVRRAAEGSILAAIFVGILATVAIVSYQCATSSGPFRKEYGGKIVDKKVTLHESNEGSFFVYKLAIEEKSGTRFQITVPQELYDRAKVGMLIQRSTKGIELFPNPDETSTSP